VQHRPINNHNYDSPSLKVVYAGNMQKNMPHICAAYFAKFCIFSHIFCPKKFHNILRKFSAINQQP